MRDGKAVEALPFLDRLARIPGHAGDAAAVLAEALLVLGRPAEAEAAATAMLAAGDAGDPVLLGLRAEARLAQGDGRGAMADAAELVIADPASPRAKALLGRVLLAAARLDEAILLLGQAFAAAPHDGAVRIALAEALAAAGRPEDAEELLATVDEPARFGTAAARSDAGAANRRSGPMSSTPARARGCGARAAHAGRREPPRCGHRCPEVRASRTRPCSSSSAPSRRSATLLRS